ncbi:MAG: hypothetical protein AAB074_11890 [Planctomycetota bacterium]
MMSTHACRGISGPLTRALAFAAFAFSACKPPAPTPPGPVSLDKIPPDLKLMAADFLREFDEKKYDGKVIEITGIYFTWTLVDDGKHATDLTLLASGWSDKLFFVLDREVMDKRWMILDYWSLISMKGRYAGRDADGAYRFTGAVLTSTHVEASEYPTALKVEAVSLTEAFWRTDSGSKSSRLYAGRVIEVSGTVVSVDGHEVGLASCDEKRPLSCRLREEDPAIAPGQTIVLKGFCWEDTVRMSGLTLDGCIRP